MDFSESRTGRAPADFRLFAFGSPRRGTLRCMGRRKVYATTADRSRAWRARRRLERQGLPPDRPALGAGAAAVAQWAGERLRVAPGHPNAGQPLVLAPFQLAVIDDVLTHRETLLCCARKNAKSALIAALALAYLVGPLRAAGWRMGILSINRSKAGELRQQIEDIALASGFRCALPGKPATNPDLMFRSTPWPGKVIGDDGSRVEIEGCGYGSGSGHASGYDLAVIDELGLLQERHRAAVAGMRSSVSAKNGRFLSLSIHGDGPFIPEILSRRGAAGLAVHHYTADPDLSIDDPLAWRQANPGLGTIKSVEYMRDEAARVLAIPSDESAFVAHDLNRAGSASGELVCAVSTWKTCEAPADDLPPRDGPACLGIDIGDVASFTSAAAYWSNGRMEVWTAVPDTPPLATRAKRDAAGSLYERAVKDGHLWPLSGCLTPIKPFLERLKRELAGVHVAAVGADRRRADELRRHLVSLSLPWRPCWRGGGARAVQDAQHDIRAFQRAVEGGELKTAPNVLFASAIAHATLLRDGTGDPTGIKQSTRRRRIDQVSAAVIACGLAALRPKRSRPGKVWVA